MCAALCSEGCAPVETDLRWRAFGFGRERETDGREERERRERERATRGDEPSALHQHTHPAVLGGGDQEEG